MSSGRLIKFPVRPPVPGFVSAVPCKDGRILYTMGSAYWLFFMLRGYMEDLGRHGREGFSLERELPEMGFWETARAGDAGRETALLEGITGQNERPTLWLGVLGAHGLFNFPGAPAGSLRLVADEAGVSLRASLKRVPALFSLDPQGAEQIMDLIADQVPPPSRRACRLAGLTQTKHR